MDSELLLKFNGHSQTTFRHCRVRFYTFFGQPLSKQLYISSGSHLIMLGKNRVFESVRNADKIKTKNITNKW